MELEKIEDNFQKFTESCHNLNDVSDYAECRILASVLKERLEEVIKECDEYIKDNTRDNSNETISWKNEQVGRLLELSYKKSSTIDPSIVNELSDIECRMGFTVTAKAIEKCGRSDLLDKYKNITESKALTLRSLKG